jgi:hypothetical protein
MVGANIYGQISTGPDQSADLTQLKYLYTEMRLEEAVAYGQILLGSSDYQVPAQLEYIHQYMAFSFFTLGQPDSARKHFLSLLTISPDKEFTLLETSPKIIDFFNRTKNDYQEINSKNQFISYPEYIFIQDRRPDAAWRSAILPGWGQHYKHQKSRAYVLGGGFIISGIVFGISAINEQKYKDAYLNSIAPEEISANYDRYNNWSKARRASLYTLAGIWLVSLADAIWSDYPKLELTYVSADNLSLLSINYSF